MASRLSPQDHLCLIWPIIWGNLWSEEKIPFIFFLCLKSNFLNLKTTKKPLKVWNKDFYLADIRSWNNIRTGKKNRNIDRKSTRLNSSHVKISYAVFCLKKKTYKHTEYRK